MNSKYRWIILSFSALIALIIHFFADNAVAVEQYYANGLYVRISAFLRLLTGWLPFSIGDVLYLIVILWVIRSVFRFISDWRKKEKKGNVIQYRLLRTTFLLIIIYIFFNLFWGINYNRESIANRLGLSMQEYSATELKEMNVLLLQKVNESKSVLVANQQLWHSSSEVFSASVNAYRTLAQEYPYFTYQPVSIKSSLWGWLGNYAGFTGYYNPFTGEAQVNTTIPMFLQPYTTCHEMAHQLGYAKENEANFLGYLAASASKDTAVKYSVYVELFLYANKHLRRVDSVQSKAIREQLLPQVKEDINIWRQFNENHQSPIEPVVNWFYGKFLQMNRQPSGLLSYDEVVSFLIAYHKKYGKI